MDLTDHLVASAQLRRITSQCRATSEPLPSQPASDPMSVLGQHEIFFVRFQWRTCSDSVGHRERDRCRAVVTVQLERGIGARPGRQWHGGGSERVIAGYTNRTTRLAADGGAVAAVEVEWTDQDQQGLRHEPLAMGTVELGDMNQEQVADVDITGLPSSQCRRPVRRIHPTGLVYAVHRANRSVP
ncbi:hypothetical protein MOV08_04195 [Streptomyces yunnanensis]|uniref:Uncharacterized protein n=1 Tax=Streptomyces yunnanensis TaxID=156453 RepID=A0ABY8A4U8_9ACTN|nr:hypothetical protein [Streptomyces yunnanensis]WEB38577.1 hypothetical protein MOV08_04195 [Streptomyces yunnanensis]